MKISQGHKPGKPIQFSVMCLLLLFSVVISILSVPTVQAAGATSSLHIIKYAEGGTKILAEKTVTYQWLETNLPVQGDGVTHYYHQGPVFEGDMWDPLETTNLKDKGAVKGTNIKDLCELVGGMFPGDEIMIAAVDGWHTNFAYANIYEPLDRQGMITLCWYNGEDAKSGESYGVGYPGNDAYHTAIQIVFMPKTKSAEGKYVFGNADMQVCLPQEKYQHFYEGFPSTNGLSGKWICEVKIYTGGIPKNLTAEKGQNQLVNDNHWIPLALGALAVILLGLGIYIAVRQKGFRTKTGKIDIKAISLLIVGILCIVASLGVYFYGVKASNQNIAWEVTLIGSNGEEKKLGYNEIKAMPGYEGRGGFFTTVGIINGPYKMKGVLLEDLCELVGGLTPSNAVLVSATDGYSAIFDYDQIHGDFATYDPKTMKEVPHGELKLVLAYEQDGRILTQDCGKPLRLAIVGDAPLLTEGLYWVKWVDRIEVINIKQ